MILWDIPGTHIHSNNATPSRSINKFIEAMIIIVGLHCVPIDDTVLQ